MYICLCRAKTEEELKNQMKLYNTVQEFLASENVANCCQQCLNEIEHLFEAKEQLK